MSKRLPNAEEFLTALEKVYKDFEKLHKTENKMSEQEYWLRRAEIEDRAAGILAEVKNARIDLDKKEVV